MTGDQADKEEANIKKKNYDQRLKLLRQQSSSDYIERAENKSKATWEVINNARNKKKRTSELKIEINEELITSPKRVANCFNTHFTNTAAETLRRIPDAERKAIQNTAQHPLTTLSTIKHTNPTEVKAIVSKLKSKNSAGIDEVSSRILKHCSDELSFPLATQQIF